MAGLLSSQRKQPTGGLLSEPITIDQRVAGLLGLDPTIERGAILPMGRDANGEMVLAWPQVAIDTLKALMLPGHVMNGGSFTPRDVTEMALDVGMLSSVVPGPAGAKRMFGGRSKPSADLPMDEASRMARAKEMGFDVDAYHGTVTKHDIESFGRKDGRGNVMETYFAPEEHKEFVNGFSSGDQGRVYPVKLKASEFLDTRKPEHKKAFEDLLNDNDMASRFGGYAKREGGEGNLPGWGDSAIIEMVRDAGYPGMVLQERPWMTSYAVFDPSHIRSRFAAFDPAKRDSTDILASYLGVPGIGMLDAMPQEQPQRDVRGLLNY